MAAPKILNVVWMLDTEAAKIRKNNNLATSLPTASSEESGSGNAHYYVFEQIKSSGRDKHQLVGGGFDTEEEANQFRARYGGSGLDIPKQAVKTTELQKSPQRLIDEAKSHTVDQASATDKGNRSVRDANKHRDEQGYNAESLGLQQRMQDSVIRRARDLGSRMRQQSGVSTARTPEMLRSEHYARLADRLNNASYWRPGVFYAAAGQPMQGEAGQIYQMPRIETEDQRQQDVNRQRWGAKAQYEELEKNVNADAAMRTLDTQGMQQITNLDNLRTMNPMQIDQLIRTNAETLWNAWQQLPYQTAQAINTASAGNMINAYKMLAWLKSIDGEVNPMVMFQSAQAMGLTIPSVWQLITTMGSLSGSDSLAKLAQWMTDHGFMDVI